MSTFFKCEFGGKLVVTWPTNESGFYDVVICDVDDTSRTVDRVTAYEAASIVVSELGVPNGETVASVEGMIRRWRTEQDDMVREPVR